MSGTYTTMEKITLLLDTAEVETNNINVYFRVTDLSERLLTCILGAIERKRLGVVEAGAINIYPTLVVNLYLQEGRAEQRLIAFYEDKESESGTLENCGIPIPLPAPSRALIQLAFQALEEKFQ